MVTSYAVCYAKATLGADEYGRLNESGRRQAETRQSYEPICKCSVTQLFYRLSELTLSLNDCWFLAVPGRQMGENLTTHR